MPERTEIYDRANIMESDDHNEERNSLNCLTVPALPGPDQMRLSIHITLLRTARLD